MRRRDTTGGKVVKTQRRKTLKRRNAPETTGGHKSSPADANEKIALLERRLTDALEQQAATSEVLKVISKSRGQLEPVFNAMLENAVRICGAKFGQLFLSEDDGFRTIAMHDVPRAFAEKRRREPFFRPSAGSPLGRVMRTSQVAHIVDVTAEQGYAEGDQALLDLAELGGARTTVAVPMLNDGELVGALSIYHKELHPFTDKQIELVQNFAAQAVIAIENTQLLNELRQRTDDLSDSLEQQTATSEVLKVISSSPGQLELVFQAMLENATRVCEADCGVLFRLDGDVFRAAAMVGLPSAYAEDLQNKARRVDAPTGLGRLARTRETVHITDLKAERYYGEGNPQAVAAVDLGGIRTYLGVPLLKENELIGAILLYCREVRPFTDKQIELVKNFASQAVIAIENARLLSELRESLQQQTATADVLKVISRSTFDLQTVLDTLVESVTRLCDAKDAFIFLRKGRIISCCCPLWFFSQIPRISCREPATRDPRKCHRANRTRGQSGSRSRCYGRP
jgi:two-component system, NtrC family, sensor kinase